MNYRRNLFQDDLCVSYLEEIFIFYADNLYINTHSTSHIHITITAKGWVALDRTVSSSNGNYKRDYCLGSERGLIR